MEIVLEKRKSKRVISVLLAAACLVSLLSVGGSTGSLIILVGGTFVLGFLRIEFKSRYVLRKIFCIAFVLVPTSTFFVGQIMQNIGFISVPIVCILLNIGIILILQFTFLLMSNDLRLSMAIGCVVPTLATLANTYVCIFRGNALTPSDLLSVHTAANVAAEYDFTPTPPMLYAMIMAAMLVLSIYCLPCLKIIRTKWSALGQVGAITVCVIALFVGGAKQEVQHWQNDGAYYNGFLLNFLLQVKEVFITEPKGYSNDAIQVLEIQYAKEDEVSASAPDIIVIMDESFADLGVFENELSTNVEVMPFVNSLQENAVHGYLYASVFGGGTANSEYEFLSGNTMAFLPQNSIVYQQYFTEGSYSLISVLKDQGYDCVAMHPYYANGWMREAVYPMMGFDEMYFLEDFPAEQLVREYVSDQEMFEYIVDYHEQHDENTPMFLFGVTMQNHGGYAYEGPNYEKTIQLRGYSQEYPDAEQYLTLIHETDKAVEYLIEYYKSIDRNVVIVFFGDHMPNLDNTFYEKLNGGAFDTLDEQMHKQMVPFFVWANFDIEEKEVPCSSINYLSTYVLEAAGISLPPYYQFLKQTESVIPVINAYGYYSQEKQGFIPIEEAFGAEAEAIKTYEILQYNNIFDKENHNEFFFGS